MMVAVSRLHAANRAHADAALAIKAIRFIGLLAGAKNMRVDAAALVYAGIVRVARAPAPTILRGRFLVRLGAARMGRSAKLLD